MNRSSKYHSFTITDVERYYNGQMPASEMHALENAALDDPFLADALEGYAFTTTPIADLDIIKQKLNKKLQERKVVAISSIGKYKWLQIAALFLIIAGAGWFVYTSNLFRKNDLARTESSAQQPSKPITESNTRLDSTAPLEQETASTPQPSTGSIVKKTVESTLVQEKNLSKKETTNEAPTPDIMKEAPDNAVGRRQVPTFENNYQADKSVQSQTKERQADNALEGRQFSKVENNYQASKSVQSPAKERQVDNALKGTVAGVQVAPANAPRQDAVNSDTIKNVDVVMSRSVTELDEVVVTGYGMKRAKKQAANNAEPREGWEHFNQYVVQNKKLPDSITITGDVELIFDVNKKGEASNIKVERSLCDLCDKEAIRLLKTGPKWKYKKGRVSIHF